MSRRRSSVQGAVSLEFLIAFPSLWVFCLCAFQVVLLARADIMVRHAADAAARSAAVVLPDDPDRYGGEPEMTVSDDSSRKRESYQSPSRGDSTSKAVTPFSKLNPLSLDGRSRREVIATAARVPLLPLGRASRARPTKPTLLAALRPGRITHVVGSLGGDLSLSFADTEGGRVQGPEVTVEVTYRHSCVVPIARHILCELDQVAAGGKARIWRFNHSATSLIHDAPYQYKRGQAS